MKLQQKWSSNKGKLRFNDNNETVEGTSSFFYYTNLLSVNEYWYSCCCCCWCNIYGMYYITFKKIWCDNIENFEQLFMLCHSLSHSISHQYHLLWNFRVIVVVIGVAKKNFQSTSLLSIFTTYSKWFSNIFASSFS